VRAQDIYKFVTHEKGILGSQGEYNRRHRKLCQPPFRSPQLLQEFADVVVQRCALAPSAPPGMFCETSSRASHAASPHLPRPHLPRPHLRTSVFGVTPGRQAGGRPGSLPACQPTGAGRRQPRGPRISVLCPATHDLGEFRRVSADDAVPHMRRKPGAPRGAAGPRTWRASWRRAAAAARW